VCSRSGTTLIASKSKKRTKSAPDDDDSSPTTITASLEFSVVETNGEGLLIDMSVTSLITTDTFGEVIVADKLYADCIGLTCAAGITPIDSTTPGGLPCNGFRRDLRRNYFW